MRRCWLGRQSWMNTPPETRPYAPRYWCSSFDMRRSSGQTGSPLSGARHQRCHFRTWWGSGHLCRTRSPGSLPSPPDKPSPPKLPMEAALERSPTPGLTYPSRWPTLDTSVAPTVASAAATVAPTLKADLARRSGGHGGGENPGRGNKGKGGSGEGAKERLNAMKYNNTYMEGRYGLSRHTGAM